MEAAIDRAGRVVIPKPLRDSLGFEPGQVLDIREHDGKLEIEAAPTPMHLRPISDGLAAVPEVEVPPLTADAVRDTLEQTRR
jgi:AbrB family looped-hinge helix DNA binding protein